MPLKVSVCAINEPSGNMIVFCSMQLCVLIFCYIPFSCFVFHALAFRSGNKNTPTNFNMSVCPFGCKSARSRSHKTAAVYCNNLAHATLFTPKCTQL